MRTMTFDLHRSHICDSNNTNDAELGRNALEGEIRRQGMSRYPALRRPVLSSFRDPRLLACSTLSRSRCIISITFPRCARGAAGIVFSTTLVLPDSTF